MNLPELLKIAEAAGTIPTADEWKAYEEAINPWSVRDLIKRLQEAEKEAKKYQWVLGHGIPESAEFWPAIKIEGLTQEQDEDWCNSSNLDASIEKLIIEMEQTNEK